MKHFSLALAVVGLAVSTLLIGWYGVTGVFEAVLSAGLGGFALLVGWQGVMFVTLGLAWWSLLSTTAVWIPIWGRMVRDSAGNCLPFSQVGGYVLGVRALTLCGVSWPKATASTMVDVTAEFLAQLVFAAFGLVMLLLRQPDSKLAWPVAIGLGAALLGGGAFIALQNGAATLIRGLATRILGHGFSDAPAQTEALQMELGQMYRNAGPLFRAVVFHLLSWICSGVASFISFRLLGAQIDLWAALAIEALLTAALSLAFAIPGYAGVQEAAFTGLGSVYGLPPDISLGVSILRRAKDLAVGIPILLIWQWVEMRRLRQARLASLEAAD